MFEKGKELDMDEKILESVAGGVPDFRKPVYDPETKDLPCPACGHNVLINGINSCGERVQCSACHRSFRVEGSTLVEE